MKKTPILHVLITSFFLTLSACQPSKPTVTLPILGEREVLTQEGESNPTDTLYHTISPFSFVNQNHEVVTEKTLADKIYVADFFFTSCPTICPVMKKQMLRIYNKYLTNNKVSLLSHSIDPITDDVATLHAFAEALGVSAPKWHFVTGEKETLYNHAIEEYMSVVVEDNEEPGGYLHTGSFLLVDKLLRIRGVYDGTKAEEVDKLLSDIDILLEEN